MSRLRTTNLDKLQRERFDVLVVGGGINGAVSAAALAGKGARVGLIDRKDFASETSQSSSNLAWGGIKYLETMEFGLVHKLCRSRNKLMRAYPSTVQEIRFFASIARGFRFPTWFLYLGALFYWVIGGGFTRLPRLLSRRKIAADEPVVKLDGVVGGFEYSDAYLHDNDARFVFNFVRSAIDQGCIAANYIDAIAARREGNDWVVTVRDVNDETASEFEIRARTLVNACGPYADLFNERADIHTRHRHVFSKGIHLIVDRVTPNKRVLTFFADDGRLFFVIPMGPKTCIGTTDTKVESPDTHVTEEDRAFVLDNINKRLNLTRPITPEDVIAERCGVRPLVVSGKTPGKVDWVKLSRKHAVEADISRNIISIFGGKLTDCLNVGDEVARAIARMGVHLPEPARVWYGEPSESVRESYFQQARAMRLDELTSAEASEPISTRLWRRYGTHSLALLEHIRQDPRQADLLIEHAEYLRVEIEETAAREMVVTLEDFLRRRSKVALVLRESQLREADGLREACRIFFGTNAEREWQRYFGSAHCPTPTAQAPAERVGAVPAA